MKNLLLLAALITPFVAHSRDFSIGLRTGIGNHYSIQANNGRHITWDKQAFMRYQATKRFATEVNFSHYSFHNPNTPLPLFFDGELVNRAKTYHCTNYEIGVQYDISIKKLQKVYPILKKFRSYLGISATVLYVYANAVDDIKTLNGGISQEKFSYLDYATVLYGINQSLIYNINRHFAISSVISYKTALGGESIQWGLRQPLENRISYVVGFGYVF